MRVEVWYDFTCPYCYIALEKLYQALARFPHRSSVQLIYRSFPLTNPVRFDEEKRHCPITDAQIACTKRWPERLQDEASQLGFHMKRHGWKWNDTLHAHRLVKLAQCYGKETTLVRLLFQELYEEAVRIDDCKTLLQIGVKAGLDETEVDVLLCLNRYKKAVLTDQAIAEEMGITSVPFFVFHDKFAIAGAKPEALFYEVLEDTWCELEREGKVTGKKHAKKRTYCEGNECKTVYEEEESN